VTPDEIALHDASLRWERLFNEDPLRMCDECYAENCVVTSMANSTTIEGRARVKQIEVAMLEAYPDRQISVTRRIVSDSTVVLESVWSGTSSDDDADSSPIRINMCTVLEYADGVIISDRTYAASTSSERAKIVTEIIRRVETS
jgi:ketosteroid isomerase-like protein